MLDSCVTTTNYTDCMIVYFSLFLLMLLRWAVASCNHCSVLVYCCTAAVDVVATAVDVVAVAVVADVVIVAAADAAAATTTTTTINLCLAFFCGRR